MVNPTPKNSLLLIIDIQEKLSRAMDQAVLARVCTQINLLATLADELKIPIFLTEQYPEGLGPTIEPIKKILAGKKYDSLSKLAFGCCEDAGFNKKLKIFRRKNIIVTGMETHVCIYLTALGLLKQKYQPFVVSDAVISREKFYYQNGLDLARQAGAVVTNTETLLFQLMAKSGTPTFKKISALLKESLLRSTTNR
ncbi:MAG: isochorismatase family protein [Deltaproteobacteria bacterium]|nr:isochorismatase family protein [Deltaproteobacteria bacterium]